MPSGSAKQHQPDGADFRRILVIQTAFIGDVILATAIVEKLHDYLPAARIDFLLRKGNERLFRGHPFMNEVLIWDKSRRWHSAFAVLNKIRSTHYDFVVNIQRFGTTGLFTGFSGARITSGFKQNPLSFLFTWRSNHTFDNVHEIQRNHQLIAPLTGGVASMPRIYPTSEDESVAAKFKAAPYITVSPTSIWFTKQFPAEKWTAFIAGLPTAISVFLLGAPSDAALCNEIADKSGRRAVINLAGKLDLLPSAALMRNALMNYVNDSSPLHLASAVNGPVTAIYCSTIPRFGFTPLSSQSFIVETREKLDCRPCGMHGFKKCPRGHFACAHTIELSALRKTLPGLS